MSLMPLRTLLLLVLVSLTAIACGPRRDIFDAPSGDTPRTDGTDTSQPPTDALDAMATMDAGKMDMDASTIDSGNNTPQPVDGGGVYEAGIQPDAIECAPVDGGPCRMTVGFGCLDREVCDNGADDDCDGRVDEGCLCVPGHVQRCFVGPPARRGVGACTDGMQTCQGSGEFGCWGPCVGGISPSDERCDGADNNCDGCPDNGLCCRTTNGSCPSGDDPRVPVGRPFQIYRLRARDFYMGTTTGVTYRWRVTGGPCDQLLFATSRRVSYGLTTGSTDPMPGGGSDTIEVTGENLNFLPTLSGDYTVRLRVEGTDGLEFDCAFIVKIRAPGFRAELCWDRTGETDVDFWVHQPGNTDDWVSGDSTCYYANCRNADALDWGYPPTPGGACREAVGGNCNNPRLDIDNINIRGVPENINIDAPNDGDVFRVAVNYFGGRGAVHPMVNIYCGGELLATYGGADVGGVRYGAAPITGFDTSGGNRSGSLWRVVDVEYHNTGGRERCNLVPIIRVGTNEPCVETNTNRTYDGERCARQPPPIPPRTDAGMPPRDSGMSSMCM